MRGSFIFTAKPQVTAAMPQPENTSSLSLTDRFGRHLHYLRLSVTDRCNLRCTYCMPPGGIDKLKHEDVLTLEEIARVAGAAVSLGVDKIRLTGGEPLLRKNLSALLGQLDRLSPRPDLRITTNGVFLERDLAMLADRGVSTVNVSLDSLDPTRFAQITGLDPQNGREVFGQVWQGIMAALECERIKVKINVVLLAGINQNEITDFARLTTKHQIAVRFIEYMPVGRRQPYDQSRFLSAEAVLEAISPLGHLTHLPPEASGGPAVRYRLDGAPGELGVISAVSSHFCANCNRLRLSAEGRLVPCLHSSRNLNLLPELRADCSDQRLLELLAQGADMKPKSHNGLASGSAASAIPMSRLGG